jgi:hypothetical protein
MASDEEGDHDVDDETEGRGGGEAGDDDDDGEEVADDAPKQRKRTEGPAPPNSNSQKRQKKKTSGKERTAKKNTNNSNNNNNNNNKKKKDDVATSKKKEILEQLKARLESQKNQQKRGGNNDGSTSSQGTKDGPAKTPPGILDKLNPFQAGQNLRQTLGSLSTLGRGLSPETKQKYYLDDRFLDSNVGAGVGGRAGGSRLPLDPSTASSLLNSELLKDAVDAADAAAMYVPEVLVVGATGEVGRLVVRRLLLEGRFQVRVLVRDLYSQTLNLLGTGVSYCQGDLQNVESLEYALTDVDKIVYVAGAPRPDEDDFVPKFRSYVDECNVEMKNAAALPPPSSSTTAGSGSSSSSAVSSNSEWEQMAGVLEVRAQLAKQVDEVGMQNLVTAYQNVRFADYGTSQAAKRSLFKFSGRPDDFRLFALSDDDVVGQDGEGNDPEMDGEQDDNDSNDNRASRQRDSSAFGSYPASNYDQQYDDEYYAGLQAEYEDDGEDYYDDVDDDGNLLLESRRADATVRTQVQWTRNEFGNGVFVGRVPRARGSASAGGEASIMSSRLRSREDPENGIDLGAGFAGLIIRLVADGGRYEAFVRTGLYETAGIEYVCEFGTDTKLTSAENKSRNRFKTVRLPFEKFTPVARRPPRGGRGGGVSGDDDSGVHSSMTTAPPFTGSDVRNLGFRFRAASNVNETPRRRRASFDATSRLLQRAVDAKEDDIYESFYMALSYVKVYRIQPEPEFVYLSDARIPPVIRNGMVRHNQRRLLLPDDIRTEEEEEGESVLSSSATTLLDEAELQTLIKLERSPEETYYKYRGEEILKKSGLSYTIIRVPGFNELATSEASTIELRASGDGGTGDGNRHDVGGLVPVSRAEVAQVCVSALLDPAALNKSVYMTKRVGRSGSARPVWDDEDISAKFDAIPSDPAS